MLPSSTLPSSSPQLLRPRLAVGTPDRTQPPALALVLLARTFGQLEALLEPCRNHGHIQGRARASVLGVEPRRDERDEQDAAQEDGEGLEGVLDGLQSEEKFGVVRGRGGELGRAVDVAGYDEPHPSVQRPQAARPVAPGLARASSARVLHSGADREHTEGETLHHEAHEEDFLGQLSERRDGRVDCLGALAHPWTQIDTTSPHTNSCVTRDAHTGECCSPTCEMIRPNPMEMLATRKTRARMMGNDLPMKAPT